MRRLIHLRHAKAERNSPSGDDFDRGLSERGRTDARLIGQVLADRGLRPDLAPGSPRPSAPRETWAEVEAAFGTVETRLFERALYHASSAVMRRMVEEDEANSGRGDPGRS